MNNSLTTALTIEFSPLLPTEWMFILCALTALFICVSFFIYKKGLFWRSLFAGFILLTLYNPVAIEEEREAVKNIVTIVEDGSLSQSFEKRTERTQKAVAQLTEKLAALGETFEVRQIKAPKNAGQPHDKTDIFDAIDSALSDVPKERRAGTIIVTDGQVHDVPAISDKDTDLFGPVHVVLSGHKKEKDRRIEIIDAPAYGMVDESVTITFKVVDTDNIKSDTAFVSIKHNNSPSYNMAVPVGEEQKAAFVIDRGGQNIIDFTVDTVDGELTETNNRSPILINGVRNRLKVLLVSGVPHTGGRTWRNLLTSDPGVDLVHFTILRDPSKLDGTPQNELSLIAFPFQELFEVKLYDFDLIIFDRYEITHILPSYYFNNITRYVQRGGAFLAANGPAYADDKKSIYHTSLEKILPAKPNGQTINQSFVPTVTLDGERHPVTRQLNWNSTQNNLDKANSGDKQWGPWLRQVPVQTTSGNALMNGIANTPLLILDRVGKGRVAQLSSDHIWLWSRGYKGGGPQADLLRRLAHWLMKEPELEETALSIYASSDSISIERRTLKDEDISVKITKPDGTSDTLALSKTKPGVLTGTYAANSTGIYTVSDGVQERFAIIGNLNAPEHTEILTTESKLRPLVKSSRGGLWWAKETIPDVKKIASGQRFSGRKWLGLRDTKNYAVTGVKQKDFVPSWFFALFGALCLILLWWNESSSSTKLKPKS
jgi:hypothetical protein